MPAEPLSLKELFLAVLAVPPAERPAWLEKTCGQDVELRRRVELTRVYRLVMRCSPTNGNDAA